MRTGRASGASGVAGARDGYPFRMDRVELGKAGLQGWRAKVGDAVAGPVARRSRFSDDQVRAVIGALFFALSVMYVAGTLKRMASRAAT
jgi:hypothetical protein